MPTITSLSDDCVLAIVQVLIVCEDRSAACCFASSCKTFASVFLAKDGLGYSLFLNYANSFKTRCVDRTKEALLSPSFPFTAQVKRERNASSWVKSIFQASRSLSMHCATDCCMHSRNVFNLEHRKHNCRLVVAAKSVRKIVLAESSRLPTAFLYYTERGFVAGRSNITHILARHVYADESMQTTTSVVRCDMTSSIVSVASPLLFLASPDGNHCAIRSFSTSGPQLIHVWRASRQAQLGNGDAADVLERQLLDRKLLSLQSFANEADDDVDAEMQVFQPRFVWWASTEAGSGGSRLMIAWSRTAAPLGIVVVKHTIHAAVSASQSANVQTCTLPFVPCRSLTYGASDLWFGMFQPYSAINRHALYIFDARNAASVRKYDVLSVTRNQLTDLQYRQRETFKNPISMCISSDGRRVAVLSEKCTHSNLAPQKEGEEDAHLPTLSLALFTRNDDERVFLRESPSGDEVRVPYDPMHQSIAGWKIEFSPCTSFITMVYVLNQQTILIHDPYPSAYFVRITPRGIQRSLPITHCKIRQVCWTRHCMAILPKHGGLFLTSTRTAR